MAVDREIIIINHFAIKFWYKIKKYVIVVIQSTKLLYTLEEVLRPIKVLKLVVPFLFQSKYCFHPVTTTVFFNFPKFFNLF